MVIQSIHMLYLKWVSVVSEVRGRVWMRQDISVIIAGLSIGIWNAHLMYTLFGVYGVGSNAVMCCKGGHGSDAHLMPKRYLGCMRYLVMFVQHLLFNPLFIRNGNSAPILVNHCSFSQLAISFLVVGIISI
jgi:hypothetical protein